MTFSKHEINALIVSFVHSRMKLEKQKKKKKQIQNGRSFSGFLSFFFGGNKIQQREEKKKTYKRNLLSKV